jgi:hypothetical protein
VTRGRGAQLRSRRGGFPGSGAYGWSRYTGSRNTAGAAAAAAPIRHAAGVDGVVVAENFAAGAVGQAGAEHGGVDAHALGDRFSRCGVVEDVGDLDEHLGRGGPLLVPAVQLRAGRVSGGRHEVRVGPVGDLDVAVAEPPSHIGQRHPGRQRPAPRLPGDAGRQAPTACRQSPPRSQSGSRGCSTPPRSPPAGRAAARHRTGRRRAAPRDGMRGLGVWKLESHGGRSPSWQGAYGGCYR